MSSLLIEPNMCSSDSLTQRHMVDDMLSADDVSCSSSQVSAKSEKNMADFDGEESGCEEELVQINSHAELTSHLQQHLPNLASIYHEHLSQGPAVHKHQFNSNAVTDINLDNVCKKGNTLLWDIVQDDDAVNLSEGLINEAEKLLCSLVCWFTDRQIRMRFIEGCLENLGNNRSVVISLRLLPKLFGTFQQFGSSYDTHWITMWAEKELNMMKLFFDNLVYYIQGIREGRQKHALYSHSAEVQVRLQFLTCVFSTLGSPDHFRLSLEQVDILWHCLVEDSECYDDALHWFLNQVRSKDQHAMGMETYKHLFLEKMPQLKPETISMTGLNLFQHLCNLARLATSAYDGGSHSELCGMDQFWGIALRAQSGDVSRAAIQYINSYYINGKTGLEKEQEFISKCMESLMIASSSLEQESHSSLTVIERGLLMLKTHLEAFRRRFAYHLRQWQIEGTGISSHLKALSDKQSLPLRVVCQPAGLPDKMTIEMYPSDQVADLRAEVTHWYENLQKEQINQQAQLQEFGQSSRKGEFPGSLMGPVRMISSGHELTTDYDEKALHELGFKDMQMVFVSLGAPRRERKGEGVQLPASCLPPPQKDNIPMLLLLQEPHLTTLFDLLEMLASFKPPSGKVAVDDSESLKCEELHLHAENLSRRVWELLMLLPTCPNMLMAFQNISDEQSNDGLNWKELLKIKSAHKLLYALEIIEALGKPNRRIRRESTGSYSDLYPDSDDSSEDQVENSKNSWSCKFVAAGGLQQLLEIFNSAILEPKEQESWTVWQLDCLACLLKLICQFAVDPSDLDLAYHDVFAWSGIAESHRKRTWPGKSRKAAGDHAKSLHIPRLTEVFLVLVQGTSLIQRLMSVAYTYDNLAPRVLKAQSDHRSRHEVSHYSMWLLVSWAHCCSLVKSSLADSDHLQDWLKKLTLLIPETAVRHESCNGLYKLSLSGLDGGDSIHRSFLLLAASTLLKFLPDAQALKPLRIDDYEEEPMLKPGCKEYFWLLCKLVDNIHIKDASQTTLLDLDALARHLADCIRSREILDHLDGNIEDDGLSGLLRLATSVIKHKPPFKFSREGQEFLRDIFNLLFLLPSLKDRRQPKCKSHSSRAAAYDLLVEMVKGSVENYRLIHNWVMAQHMQSHAPYKWDYWPHEDVRAECRFVGLTNLGATCYLASTIQQLYMIPEARQAVFTAKYSEDMKHKTTLLELQKMFTYLMESECKAYNPRPFCKTYTMDKQPLNTGEQKDMTEFFTDLITKVEEMSPELKNTVKSLFGGVITNNVVSLDCEHVSQTAEEFYTVRCQVADMKNIYWFLDRMADDDWWPMQILIKCPNQIVRQMFQRLCIHVIQRLRPVHAHLYLQPGMEDGSDDMDASVEDIGGRSCVTRFVRTLLLIMEHGVKPHSKHLTEYFAFLYEFAKMGEEEPQVEVLSEEEGEEEEEEEDILSLAEEKYRPAALEKMIALVALLVEQSRSERHLTLSQTDMAALTGGKGFPFLFQHIRDGINIRQTCNLIFSLCRYNNRLAEHIVSMLFTSIAKLTPEAANPFFKLLTMLMEFAGGPPGMPPFASYILQRIWEVIEYNPSQCLDWLAVQTPRNKLAHSWVLQNMENWVERFLLAHNYPRVRTSAAYLLVSLIPSNSFRQMFRSTRSLHIPTRDLPLSPDTTVVLHQVYNVLLGLLSRAKLYVDAAVHGTTKLVPYFSFMTYCLISKTEKLMFSTYFMDLWNLFQPKLSEPAIATNHNKQALLSFWYNVCADCPENIRLIVQNPVVTKNIAFNYILADHDDQDVVLFNRGMLPAYYGILRLCCEQSPAFTRQLASHQNIQWAFKNLTPHASQYPGAVEELFNLMQLFIAQRPDMREEELEDIKQFKKTTISCYLRCLDGRSCWTTLISAFRILLESDEDRLLVVFNRGLILMTESFNTLHMMYHEATACHVTGDLVELLSIFLSVLKSTRPYLQRKDVKQALIQWQERIEFAHKLLTLLNSYSPPELRNACIDVLKELVLLSPHDFLHTLVPFLQHNHCTYHHSNIPMSLGPYFPCRENIKLIGGKSNIRPPRPELNMCLLPTMVETSKGKDDVYDRMLLDYFFSYHQFIHLLCRVAINCEKFTETLVKLSVLVAYEGLPLHLALFPKLWTELCQTQSSMSKNCIKLLCEDPVFAEYIKCILMDERTFLNNNIVYTFMTHFLLKVYDEGATPVKRRRVSSDEEHTVDSCIGDIKADTREVLTPTSTSDNETRDSSIIDPGTEQDLPSPENGSVKEYRMEGPSSFSEDGSHIRSQHAEEQSTSGRFDDCKEFKDLHCSKDTTLAEDESEFPSTSISAVLSDLADLRSCDGQALSSQDPEAALSLSCGHSRGLFSHMQQHDILDTLCRTIESTIHVVTRISGKGNQAAS
ncbi:ubiquitin specific peptidase 34 [Cricetulus griseus]